MEIEHIGDNKIRCALTEQEIESLGYDIDEIIANSEITQEFMHTVLELVEEQEHIQMEGISPMVKAELLQDHSVGDHFWRRQRGVTEGSGEYGQSYDQPAGSGCCTRENGQGRGGERTGRSRYGGYGSRCGTHKRTDPMICALRFSSFENMRRMSLLAFRGKIPKSSLYKMDGAYYLILDYGICQGGDASICVRNDRV